MSKCCSVLASWSVKASPLPEFVRADGNIYYFNFKWDNFFTTTVSSECTSSPDNFGDKYY